VTRARVGQPGEQPRLAGEAGAVGVVVEQAEELDRDIAVEHLVVRGVYVGHPARAEQIAQLVPALEQALRRCLRLLTTM